MLTVTIKAATAVIRVGDKTTGHSKYPPQAAIEGSDDVLIDGKGVVRAYDLWEGHTCEAGLRECFHDGVVRRVKNTSVFINGEPVVTAGDILDCGDVCKGGDSSVIIGSGNIT